MNKLIEHKKNYGPNSLITKIIEIMEKSPYITEESYLPYEDRFCGYTDYLDQVLVKDLKLPIMWGIDRFDRLFIAVKAIYYDSEGQPLLNRIEKEVPKSMYETVINMMSKFYYGEVKEAPVIYTKEDYESVEVFFQRYTNVGFCWATGTSYLHSNSISEDNYEVLENLLLHGEAKCKYSEAKSVKLVN